MYVSTIYRDVQEILDNDVKIIRICPTRSVTVPQLTVSPPLALVLILGQSSIEMARQSYSKLVNKCALKPFVTLHSLPSC